MSLHGAHAMLVRDTGIYFKLPDSVTRDLQPASVTDVIDGVVTARLDEPHELPAPGAELLIFHDVKGEFSRRPVRVEAIVPAGEGAGAAGPIIAFRVLGDPVSAENRQCYRVSTVMSGLRATVGGEGQCPVLNVSATGLAVAASPGFEPGNVLDVSIAYEERLFEGQATVQTARARDDGRVRYGLHCHEDRLSRGTLEKGLGYISVAVQQQQLRRRAGRRRAR